MPMTSPKVDIYRFLACLRWNAGWFGKMKISIWTKSAGLFLTTYAYDITYNGYLYIRSLLIILEYVNKKKT